MVSSKFQYELNTTEIDKIVCARCSVIHFYEFERCIFSINSVNIFHHLKLEIALAIIVLFS